MFEAIARTTVTAALIVLSGSAVAGADPVNPQPFTPPPPSPPVQCLYLPAQIQSLNTRAQAAQDPNTAALLRHQAQILIDQQLALQC